EGLLLGDAEAPSAPFHTNILPSLSTATSWMSISSSLTASSTFSVRSNSNRSARYDTRPSRCSQATVCATTSENFIRCSYSADNVRSQYDSPWRTTPQQQTLSAIDFLCRGTSLPVCSRFIAAVQGARSPQARPPG